MESDDSIGYSDGSMRSEDAARRPPGPSARPPRELAADVAPSVVVFLVALPLCLGIAHGSGAPLVAGMITGIVGGLFVGLLSGSQLGVSGPAAGLTTIVLAALSAEDPHHLGYEGFLLAVVLAGAMQLALGALQAGIVAYYFPSNVIKGLLAAIGALIILKQLPHALGIDTDWMGDEELLQEDGRTTFTEPIYALTHLRWGALVVAALGLGIIVAFDQVDALKRLRVLRFLPAPLLAVLAGLGLNALFPLLVPGWTIEGEDLVRLPEGGPLGFVSQLTLPDFRRIDEPLVWSTALTLAAVASLETLLCVEAIDKLDPYRRSTPTNRELFAQGLGNIVAGMLGGLPLTAVIVRGSANIQAGGRTKLSAILHGVWLLLAVLFLAPLLNRIPLASLAAILLYVGYKLTRATLWKQMWSLGWEQFLPFLVTFVAIISTNLLRGVAIGLAVAVFLLLRRNFLSPYFVHEQEAEPSALAPRVRIELAEHVSFLHKAAVRKVLEELPHGTAVEIDGARSKHIDRDVLEIIDDFRRESVLKEITVQTTGLPAFVATDGH